MNPGRLDTRITITPPGTGLDALGQPTAAGGTPVTVWAAVYDVKVADRAAGNAVLSEATTTALIRFRAGVASTWTVTIAGDVFSIVAIADGFKKREQRLFLKAL
jgi:SPP1 family predicted phage head-tail adaptor